MIRITDKNLKWAYKKLKYYIYYYKSFNYLKDKIYEFEEKYENDIEGFTNYFKELERKLNSFIPESNLNGIYKLNYFVYPKKDTIKCIKVNTYNVSEFNFFIDMDLELYLVDILFALTIYEKTKSNTNSDSKSYGNVFSKALCNTVYMETPFLFENHRSQYKKWKNSIYKNLDSIKNRNAIVVKMDMKRCFYNFEFDFKEFTEKKLNEIDSNILIIERFLYNKYTNQLCNDFLQKQKDKNICILPIGLLSSYAILNYYFSFLDDSIDSNDKVINYGRYVDDILVLIKYSSKYAGKSGTELIESVFSNNLIKESDKICFNVKEIGLKKNIPLNTSKIKVKLVKIKNLKSKKENLKEMYAASFENEDRESCVEMSTDTISSLRNYFFNTEISHKKKMGKIEMMESHDLLNAYPIWKYMFNIICKDKKSVNELKQKIQKAITNCDCNFKKNSEEITLLLKKTLTLELKVANSLVFDEKYKRYFIDDIEQLDYFTFIDSYKENNYEYKNMYKYTFPLIVSREMLMLYNAETLEVNNEYEQAIANDYEKINKIKMRPLNLKISKQTIVTNICKVIEKNIHIEEHKNSKIKEKVSMAVVNLSISEKEIKEYDLQEAYNCNFNYDTIRKIIVNASKHGAKYILFPEFAIPYHDAYKVIKLAKENHVSIISGLTHKLFVLNGTKEINIKYKDKKPNDKVYAKNLTLIYDNYLNIVNLYVKKNLAPSEIKFLLKNKIYGIQGKDLLKVYHSIINYGILTCYDATDINLRGKYKNYVDTLFLPVMNKDTEYFSAIIKSLSRDLSAYIVQSNINEYGDSRITGPFQSYKADIVKSKGGINCYYVLEKINYTPLYNRLSKDKSAHNFFESIKDRVITENDYEKYINLSSEGINEFLSKPTSAGTNFEDAIFNQKNKGIQDLDDIDIDDFEY